MNKNNTKKRKINILLFLLSYINEIKKKEIN